MQVAPKFQVGKENLIEQVKIGFEPDDRGENLRLKTKNDRIYEVPTSIHRWVRDLGIFQMIAQIVVVYFKYIIVPNGANFPGFRTALF